MDNDKNLEKLLSEVSKLFRNKDNKKAASSCYDFSLSKMPYGWIFCVINSWQKWLASDLETQFGAYQTPKEAVIVFLQYVKKNKLQVNKLME